MICRVIQFCRKVGLFFQRMVGAIFEAFTDPAAPGLTAILYLITSVLFPMGIRSGLELVEQAAFNGHFPRLLGAAAEAFVVVSIVLPLMLAALFGIVAVRRRGGWRLPSSKPGLASLLFLAVAFLLPFGIALVEYYSSGWRYDPPWKLMMALGLAAFVIPWLLSAWYALAATRSSEGVGIGCSMLTLLGIVGFFYFLLRIGELRDLIFW